MLNLLTEEQKKVIKKEYHLRLVFIVTCFLISVGIILFFFLLPFYYLSTMRFNLVNSELEKSKAQNAKRDYTSYVTTVKSTKEITDSLKPVLTEKSVRDEVLLIINQKDSSIKINNIVWTKEPTGGHFNVSGVAKNREGLQSFRNKLASLKEFTAVELPVSSYSKVVDLNFNLTITYKP
jgi:capsular polysaccharide biosynthesis protein